MSPLALHDNRQDLEPVRDSWRDRHALVHSPRNSLAHTRRRRWPHTAKRVGGWVACARQTEAWVEWAATLMSDVRARKKD